MEEIKYYDPSEHIGKIRIIPCDFSGLYPNQMKYYNNTPDTSEMVREWKRKKLIKSRKEKLNKIFNN
jgi:hypothetical protein